MEERINNTIFVVFSRDSHWTRRNAYRAVSGHQTCELRHDALRREQDTLARWEARLSMCAALPLSARMTRGNAWRSRHRTGARRTDGLMATRVQVVEAVHRESLRATMFMHEHAGTAELVAFVRGIWDVIHIQALGWTARLFRCKEVQPFSFRIR